LTIPFGCFKLYTIKIVLFAMVIHKVHPLDKLRIILSHIIFLQFLSFRILPLACEQPH